MNENKPVTILQSFTNLMTISQLLGEVRLNREMKKPEVITDKIIIEALNRLCDMSESVIDEAIMAIARNQNMSIEELADRWHDVEIYNEQMKKNLLKKIKEKMMQ